VAQEAAEAVAHRADAICPYSKATRGNIDVTLTVATA
jgi:organic hydroperoxide reductase OsmC/OhrA